MILRILEFRQMQVKHCIEANRNFIDHFSRRVLDLSVSTTSDLRGVHSHERND